MMQNCLGTFVTLRKNHTQAACDNKRDKAIRDFDCVLPLSSQQHKELTEALRDAHATFSLTNNEARIKALKVIGIGEGHPPGAAHASRTR